MVKHNGAKEKRIHGDKHARTQHVLNHGQTYNYEKPVADHSDLHH